MPIILRFLKTLTPFLESSLLKKFDLTCSLVLIFSLVAFTTRFCRKQTDTFTILSIYSNHPYFSEFSTRSLEENEEKELNQALNQAYQYYGRGGQSYVFFSQDGQFVIKFFKQRLFQPSWFLNHFPLPPFLHKFKAKRNWKRQDKRKRDFTSYKIAFEILQKETGVLYTHLNRTSHLNKQLKVKDRLGILHLINLDDFDFVVQYRAVPVFEKINYLMKEQKIEEARNAIASLFELLKKRADKGFRDRDPNIETNCGFIGSEAVKIDVGRFVPCAEMKNKEKQIEEMTQIMFPFENWIQQTHPSLYPLFLDIKKSYMVSK